MAIRRVSRPWKSPLRLAEFAGMAPQNRFAARVRLEPGGPSVYPPPEGGQAPEIRGAQPRVFVECPS
eukprot:13360414-Heterocapsa_arctica.AAC.1